MKVGELIKELNRHPKDKDVRILFNNRVLEVMTCIEVDDYMSLVSGIKQFRIYLDDDKVKVIGGNDIHHALQKTGYEGYNILNWEEIDPLIC